MPQDSGQAEFSPRRPGLVIAHSSQVGGAGERPERHAGNISVDGGGAFMGFTRAWALSPKTRI